MSFVMIPKDALSPEALTGLLDAFITREGTDVGHADHTLDDKRRAVRAQIDRGDVVIVFDPETESTNLLTRSALTRLRAASREE